MNHKVEYSPIKRIAEGRGNGKVSAGGEFGGAADARAVESFIEKWRITGGAERGNTQPFLTDLCGLLGVEAPAGAVPEIEANDYVFERPVRHRFADGTLFTLGQARKTDDSRYAG